MKAILSNRTWHQKIISNWPRKYHRIKTNWKQHRQQLPTNEHQSQSLLLDVFPFDVRFWFFFFVRYVIFWHFSPFLLMFLMDFFQFWSFRLFLSILRGKTTQSKVYPLGKSSNFFSFYPIFWLIFEKKLRKIGKVLNVSQWVVSPCLYLLIWELLILIFFFHQKCKSI